MEALSRTPSFLGDLPKITKAPFIEQPFTLQKAPHEVTIDQWVQSVAAFSTQYASGNWSANEVIGPPKVYPNYGDLQGAWAPGRFHNMEFIDCVFAKQVHITGMDIYETHLPGAVTKISAKVGNNWEVLYEGEPNHNMPPTARIFKPTLVKSVLSNIVKIEVNCLALESWPEIDCVKLIGYEVIRKDPPAKGSLAYDMKSLLSSSSLFADTTFMVDGKPLKAHRAILWARSDVFRAMFSNQMLEANGGVVHISDFTYEAFSQMLEYVYTGYVETKEEHLLALYCAADKYDFPGLRDICLDDLFVCLTPDNVPLVLTTVAQIEGPSQPLVDVCLRYIRKHIKAVVSSKNFDVLPRELVVDILRDSLALLRT